MAVTEFHELSLHVCQTARRHTQNNIPYSHRHQTLISYIVFTCSTYSLLYFPSAPSFSFFLNRLYYFLNTYKYRTYAVVANTPYRCSSLLQGVPVISMTSYLDSDWVGTLSNASLICHFDTINPHLHDLLLISTRDKGIIEPIIFWELPGCVANIVQWLLVNCFIPSQTNFTRCVAPYGKRLLVKC